jgi:2-amino-4-hydroxy-6-hydroxymethyldihydropteridine diphosphokinase
MARVVILTGSNRGDKALALARAAEALEERVGTIVRRSAVHESAPWGFSDPESFLNQVLILETNLQPLEVLDRTQAIEKALGRVSKHGRGGYEPRPIDLDILFYDDLCLTTERLTVPHPLIAERQFVLVPLREVMGDFIHPVYGKPIREL